MHPGARFPSVPGRIPPYICPGRKTERARTAGPKCNLKTMHPIWNF